MAYNQLIDGTLRVLGALTVSNLTVSNSVQVPIGASFALNATALTLTASSTSSALLSACTQNVRAGKITTTALTTVINTSFSLLVTNSVVSTTDLIFWSVTNGTNTATQGPFLTNKLVTNGAVTFVCNTISQALNGTLIFDYAIFK